MYSRPELIIVCGQLLAAGDLFLEPMHAAITEYAIKANLSTCKITGSTFDEHPEAFGAALAAIARDDLLSDSGLNKPQASGSDKVRRR